MKLLTPTHLSNEKRTCFPMNLRERSEGKTKKKGSILSQAKHLLVYLLLIKPKNIEELSAPRFPLYWINQIRTIERSSCMWEQVVELVARCHFIYDAYTTTLNEAVGIFLMTYNPLRWAQLLKLFHSVTILSKDESSMRERVDHGSLHNETSSVVISRNVLLSSEAQRMKPDISSDLKGYRPIQDEALRHGEKKETNTHELDFPTSLRPATHSLFSFLCSCFGNI